ncbi:hypothetical protein [Desulfovibrio inopinatus]|uniref:hypothetical protein n=1 Tax=Desulfovibrio inopinatus TaxID=102109 RepID=UPI000488C9FF|nr:hypothetical protein [Desulfovibrio inopinatus]
MEPRELPVHLKSLRMQLNNGRLTPQAFDHACAQLRTQDRMGNWWTVDPDSGALLRYDQRVGQWLHDTPASKSQAPAQPPMRGEMQPPSSPLVKILQTANTERTGLVGAAMVLILGAALSWFLYPYLGLIPKWLSGLAPEVRCTMFKPNTSPMYFCSGAAALSVLSGPIIVMVGIFLLRKQITALLSHVTPFVPTTFRFLLPPAVACLLFTILWAGAHYDTVLSSNSNVGNVVGLVHQRLFPAFVALFTYAVARYGPLLQLYIPVFFDLRDKIHKHVRFVIVLVFPMLYSLINNMNLNDGRIYKTALEEQKVVVMAMLLGFLLLAPRNGKTGMKD